MLLKRAIVIVLNFLFKIQKIKYLFSLDLILINIFADAKFFRTNNIYKIVFSNKLCDADVLTQIAIKVQIWNLILVHFF